MNLWISITVVLVLILSFIAYITWFPCAHILGKSICKLHTKEKIIVLTFDDGPGQDTRDILSILNKENITAVFFIVGDKAIERPDVLKQTVADGHIIAVHAMQHKFLIKDNVAQILKTKNLLQKITNQSILFFRPPYGFRTPTTMRVARDASLTTVLWSSFPRDYSSSKDQIIRRVSRSLKPGVIITLHDGPAYRENTRDALPEIIKRAKEQGFRFANKQEIETLMSVND